MGSRQDDELKPGGSMPTSGANRPGPLRPRPIETPTGTNPVAIRLARLGIDTDVEPGDFESDLPVAPSTPWVTAWYPRSSLLGVKGLVLIGGSTGVQEDGPSAFTRLGEANAGDLVEMTGRNGGTFTFVLESIDAQAAPPDFSTLLTWRDAERLALLGWEGDYPTGGDSTVVLATGIRQI